MKIVADNHAETLRRPGSADTAQALLLDTIAATMRVRLGEAADLPPTLARLAACLDGRIAPRSEDTRRAA